MLSSATLFQHVKKHRKVHPAEHDSGSNHQLSAGHHPKLSTATFWKYIISHVVHKRHYPYNVRNENDTGDHTKSPTYWPEDNLQAKVSPPPYEYPLTSSPPPPYTCTVYKYGHVSFKQEFGRERSAMPRRHLWK